jgi:hypothetical protein
MLAKMWNNKNLLIAGGSAQCYSHYGRQFGSFLQTKQSLTIWSSYMLLDTFLHDLRIYFHTKACAWMFIIALFIIIKTWEATRMTFKWWMDEKKKPVGHPYNRIILCFKRNEISNHEKKKFICTSPSASKKPTRTCVNIHHHL